MVGSGVRRGSIRMIIRTRCSIRMRSRKLTGMLRTSIGARGRGRWSSGLGWRGSEADVTETWRPNLKPSAALERHRDEIRAMVPRFRTANPRVFGSVLHGTDRDDSDLDLLVDALPGATLFDLGGLQAELEELLGVSVDLVTPGDLPPKFRQRVLPDARPV